MKNKLIFISLIGFALWYIQCKEDAYGRPYYEYSAASLDSLRLDDIQTKINNAFIQAIMTRKDEGLATLKRDLQTLDNSHHNPLVKYWQGYLQYYCAIYHIQADNKSASEQEVKSGIDILNNINNKNSEDLAMLALLQSFSIQFKSGIEAGSVSSKVKSNVKKAIKLDDQNLRAYYVAGSNDFYTPEQYGGGKEVENYLLKAVSLPDQQIKSIYLPSWGKDLAYEMLIKWYIKKEDWANAKKYFQIANGLYPQNYPISQLAIKLVNK